MRLDVPIRHLMTGSVQTLPVDASLTDAATLFVNGGFHHVPVVDGEHVVGILSASDLLDAVRTVPPQLRDTGVIDSDETVGDRMVRDVVVIGIDDSVRHAVQAFADGSFHALPVVAGGRLVGIVTTRDLCRHLLAD